MDRSPRPRAFLRADRKWLSGFGDFGHYPRAPAFTRGGSFCFGGKVPTQDAFAVRSVIELDLKWRFAPESIELVSDLAKPRHLVSRADVVGEIE